MPILIVQARNNKNHIATAVRIEFPIDWTDKKTGFKLKMDPGKYLIKHGDQKYLMSENEFEDTYLIRKIIEQ